MEHIGSKNYFATLYSAVHFNDAYLQLFVRPSALKQLSSTIMFTLETVVVYKLLSPLERGSLRRYYYE